MYKVFVKFSFLFFWPRTWTSAVFKLCTEHNKTSNPSSEPENLFNITKICVGLIMLCPWRPLPLRAVYVQKICRVKEKAVIEFKVTVLFFSYFFHFPPCVWCDPLLAGAPHYPQPLSLWHCLITCQESPRLHGSLLFSVIILQVHSHAASY